MGRGEELDRAEAALLVTPMNFPTPEGRFVLDYGKVLRIGFNGILKEIEEGERRLKVVTMDDFRKVQFYKAARSCCEGIITWANNHASLAERLARRNPIPGERRSWNSLLKPADGCRPILPGHFMKPCSLSGLPI